MDSTVWSLALRRRAAASSEATHLTDLIKSSLAVIIDPIRQEVLSGIRHPEVFARIRAQLRAFPVLALSENHYELAAEFFNTCRSRGIQGSNIDFLICAAAHSYSTEIFTADHDFRLFARHLPIKLHEH